MNLIVPPWLARLWYWGGLAGGVVAVAALAVGWQLLSGFGDSTSRTLGLLSTTLETTVESASTALETLALAEEGMEQTEIALGSAGTGLTQMSLVLADTADLLGSQVPDTLDAINASFPAMIDTARVIDTTMSALSFLGVDYSPDIPLDESLQAVSEDLEPLSENLRAQAGPLAAAATEIESVGRAVDFVGESVNSITQELAGSRELVTRYQTAAADATELVSDVSSRFAGQVTMARILLLTLGAAVLIVMTVPVVLGRKAMAALGLRA
jgi:hypothetical protein